MASLVKGITSWLPHRTESVYQPLLSSASRNFILRHFFQGDKETTMRDEPLSRAIIAAGSVSALAQKIGVTPQAVSAWERVPAERAKDVEAATGVPRYELRPDLWDPPLFSQQAI